jgi:hypothetical protein
VEALAEVWGQQGRPVGFRSLSNLALKSDYGSIAVNHSFSLLDHRHHHRSSRLLIDLQHRSVPDPLKTRTLPVWQQIVMKSTADTLQDSVVPPLTTHALCPQLNLCSLFWRYTIRCTLRLFESEQVVPGLQRGVNLNGLYVIRGIKLEHTCSTVRPPFCIHCL